MFESLPVSVITPSRAFCRLSSVKLIAVLSHTLNLFHRFLVTGHHANRSMSLIILFSKTAQWCFYQTHFTKLFLHVWEIIQYFVLKYSHFCLYCNSFWNEKNLSHSVSKFKFNFQSNILLMWEVFVLLK